MTPIYIYIYLLFEHYVQELFETLVVWSLGFPGPYTSMDRSLALLCVIGFDRSRVMILSLARYMMSLYYIIGVIMFKMEGMG